MNNKQYYSCDRNHYFFGKLMTVRDFESEQTYFNSKRRLGNRMLNGVGIVSGLDIILVDNKTFSLETGMALDYMGREIVVPEPCVRRLNVIKGFDENKDKGIVYLCLGYKENLKETTFSVAGSGKSNGVSEEFNRVSEGYELFLTSVKPKEETLKLDSLVKQRITVYNKDGISIIIEMDRYVNPSGKLSIRTIFQKENVEAPIKYSFTVRGEFFKSSEDDSEELKIDYHETEISTYKSEYKEYSMNCDANVDTLAELRIDKDSFKLEVGSDTLKISEDIALPLSIRDTPIKDIIIDQYYSKHFDEIIDDVDDKYIYLAKFHLITNKLTYFIEGFEKHPFKQYLFSNELLKLLDDLKKSEKVELINKNNDEKFIEAEEAQPKVLDLPEPKIENVTTGVERINLGFNPKVGRCFYSYEFVHGLGEGNIAVITAIDNKANYLTDDKGLLVFGDKGIFTKEEISISAPNVQIAAVSNSEKGTIKLGVKLMEKTTLQAVDVRWWAIKPAEVKKEEEDLVIDESVRVVITPNTARVKPLEQIRFSAVIEGASSQEIRWAMAENNTGTIDNNGLYTAPSKEGVYEVKAYSVKFENKSDSAYVVVSASE